MRLASLIFLSTGCQEASLPPKTPDSDSSEVTYGQVAYQEGAAHDLMVSLNSVGTSVTFTVEKGALYEIKVLVDPWREDEVIVHQQRVVAKSPSLKVGVFCSLAYSIAEDVISIHPEREQIVLEVGDETFPKDVGPSWPGGYRPDAVTAKAIPITTGEEPFLVMFHPNNMGADDFETAVKHAAGESSYGEIAGTIRKVNQAGNASPANDAHGE